MKIFISSTYLDLKEYREKVINTIMHLGFSVIGMEFFNSQTDDPTTFSEKQVEECDVYIGIIGRRYGHIPKNIEKSVTHLEYETAINSGKKVLIYLMDRSVKLEEDKVDFGIKSEKLIAFRKELEEKHVGSYFTTPDDLALKITTRLQQYIPKDGGSSKFKKPFKKLPRRLSFFVGREKELEEICNALRASHVVQIRGLGGIGKSALAIEAAYKMQDSFRDGAIWLFAPEHETLEPFINALAAVFEVTIGQMSLEDKKIFIQKILADKKAILILDNVEDANIAEDIINIVPHFPVLITSRPNIKILRDIDEWIDLSELSLEEAVKLFAQISKRSFLGEEYELVKNICKELGNFPLAIELAAQLFRISYLDLKKLWESIKKSSLDAIHVPDFVDNRKVAVSFLSTYQILTDAEKQLFNILGTFPGRTFGFEAIKAVSGYKKDEEVQFTLHNKLIALSLVKFEDGRYNLHPLLKSFARKQLSTSEPYKKMAEYFTEYAKLNTNNFDALEMERANLLGAIDWSFENRRYDFVVELVEALVGELAYFSFLSQRGYWNEAIQRLEQEIEAIRNLSGGGHTGRIHLSLGLFHYYLGNHDEAREAHKLAMEEFEKENNTRLLIVAYWQSGYIEDDEDNYNKAIELYQKSLELASESEDCKDYILNSRKLVGVVKYHQGDYEGARVDMEQSLDEAIARNNKADIGTCQRRLAAVIRRQAVLESDDPKKQSLLQRSRQLLYECLDIEHHERSIARALRQLGMVEQTAGDIDKAKNYFDRSLELFRRIGNRKGIASVLYNLGTMLEEQNDLEGAKKLYKESLELGRALKVRMGVALNLRQLGLIECKSGNIQKAVHLITEAVKILEAIRSPYLQETREKLVQAQDGICI